MKGNRVKAWVTVAQAGMVLCASHLPATVLVIR
jgi:hypothetical protein